MTLPSQPLWHPAGRCGYWGVSPAQAPSCCIEGLMYSRMQVTAPGSNRSLCANWARRAEPRVSADPAEVGGQLYLTGLQTRL